MERSCDVIIANPCGRTGETVAASLERGGIRTLIIEGPSARKDPSGYLRALHKAVAETGAEMIIPVFFPEVLAAHREEFPGITIALDSAEKLEMLDNKVSACGLAAQLGIPQPRIFGSPDEVESYPVVFRRPSGQGGDSVYFPRSRRALENLLRTAPEGIITAYMEGDDISVDALRWDGFFHAAAYKVLEPKGKGVSRRRVSIEAPELVEQVRRLLDHVDYKGVCGVDFRDSFFLECNPRFSGGLESAIASGFDIPMLLYSLAHGGRPNPDAISFTPGVVTGNN